MAEKFCVRASRMKHLETLDQVRCRSPEPLGDFLGRCLSSFCRWEFRCYLLLSKGVVLKSLSCLSAINGRRKHVVQAKLPRKHVHHDVHDAVVGSVGVNRGRPLVTKPVQHIFVG